MTNNVKNKATDHEDQEIIYVPVTRSADEQTVQWALMKIVLAALKTQSESVSLPVIA